MKGEVQTSTEPGCTTIRAQFAAALICAIAAALLKWPLLVYPSVDDIDFIQKSLHEGDWLTVTIDHLMWGRLLPVPIFSLGYALGIPNFVVGQIFFLPTEFLFSLVVILALRRLWPAGNLYLFAGAAFVASFSPGFIELMSFSGARVGLSLSLAAIALFLYYAPLSRPRWLAIGSGIAALAVMLSYQGAMNLLFLAIAVVLLEPLTSRRTTGAGVHFKALAAIMVGILAAGVLNFLMMRLFAQQLHLKAIFHLIPPTAMLGKVAEMAARFPDGWNGPVPPWRIVFGRRFALSLLVLGPFVAAIFSRSLRGRQTVAVVVMAGAAFLISLQPLSLPFDYNYFPPRTAFWLVFAAILIGVACVSMARLSQLSSVVLLASWGLAGAIVVGQGLYSTYTYAALRQNDMALAREIVGRLESANFDWDNGSVYVQLGPWSRPPAYLTKPGTPGDMMSLFLASWSRIPLLSLAAGIHLNSRKDGSAEAAKLCVTLPPNPPRYRLIIEKDRAVVCL